MRTTIGLRSESASMQFSRNTGLSFRRSGEKSTLQSAIGRETETGHGWKKMAKKKPMKHRMTEAEWIVSNDSYAILQPCRSVIMDHRRKGYLFAAAFWSRTW